MTSTILAGLGGLVLSLLFSYLPGLQPWYSKLPSQTQSLIMLGCVLVVALIAFGLSCAKLEEAVTCSTEGLYGLLKLVAAAAISNVTTYVFSPQKK